MILEIAETPRWRNLKEKKALSYRHEKIYGRLKNGPTFPNCIKSKLEDFISTQRIKIVRSWQVCRI